MGLAIWAYATRGRRLVAPDLEEEVVRMVFVRGLGAPIGFLISIPVAIVNPPMTQYIWMIFPGLLTFGARAAFQRRHHGA
jgi:hypothetical protein